MGDTRESTASVEETLVGPDRPDQASLELDLERGAQLGRYTILDHIGGGAMGVVYSAYDPELDRKVALKLLRARRSAQTADDDSRAPLLREAQAMAKLSHPNVVTVHDTGTIGARVWLAMEFVSGSTLGEWLAGRNRPWRQVVAVFGQAGRGLAAAHAAGLVHGDFKPDNVMVRDDGLVVVMDFGLARRVDGDSMEVTSGRADPSWSGDARDKATGGVRLLGTPAYMAPEQFAGHSADARSDQFAFCVALWEALAGTRPFAGDRVTELTLSVTHGKLREVPRGRMPAWLRRVVERGLRVNAEDRWPSMRALLAAIEDDPTRRRRRRVAVGAVVLVALGVVAAREIDRSRHLAACAREGSAIHEVWNATSEAELREHLLASGVPHAQTTSDKLVPWIARHAAQWEEARIAACERATVDETWATETEARAIACLQERRAGMVALLEALSAGGKEALAASIDAASRLPSAEACTDERMLSNEPAIPTDRAADIDDVRTALAELSVGADLRRSDAGKQAEDLLARATALGWDRGIGKASLLAGTVAMGDSAFAESRKRLREAYAIAVRLGDDGLAVDAALAMIRLESLTARHEEALLWDSLASAHFDRSGEDEGPRHARHLNYLASLYDEMGDYDRARDLFERTRAVIERVNGADHPGIVYALEGLGALELEAGNFDAARAHLLEALDIARTTYGADHPRVPGIMSAIGGVELTVGNFAEAERWCRDALAGFVQDGNDAGAGTALVNIGNVYLRRDDPLNARASYMQALPRLEATLGANHPKVARLLTNVANTYLDDPKSAAPVLERARQIMESALGREHPDLVVILANLGRVKKGLGDRELAREHFVRAIAIADDKLPADHPEAMRARYSLGILLEEQGDFAAAEPYFERAITGWSQSVGPDHLDVANARFALARVRWQRGIDRASARALAEQVATSLRGKNASKLAEVEAWLATHRI